MKAISAGAAKGNEGRGAAGKVPVLGILKRRGKGYTQISDNTRTTTLMPIIRRRITPDRIVYPDRYRSYHALDSLACKHYRINHSKLFAAGRKPSNEIENFWNQAKRVLRQYYGMPANQFYWFLKEGTFRFHDGSHHQQFRTLKKWCTL